MKTGRSATRMGSLWGTLALAAGLTCSVTGAQAAAVTASVTAIQVCGFGVDTSTSGCLVDPVSTSFPFWQGSQGFSLSAKDGSGLAQAVSGGPGLTFASIVSETAQTSAAKATAQSYEGVIDSTTQQNLPPTFTVTAEANRTAAHPSGNSASANFMLSGAFCMADGAFECNTSGDLTFTIFYDLAVALAAGDTPPAHALASIGVHAVGFDGLDQPMVIDLADFANASGDGSTSGSFTFTLRSLAGAPVILDIDLSALAAVPEPGVLALALLGLAGTAAARRRRPAGAVTRLAA